MKYHFLFFLLLTTFYLLLTFPAEAASLNLVSPVSEIGVGQQFQVDLVLDTENEEINAVEGKVIFPENLLELKEIRDGNSIVNFWIERPAKFQLPDSRFQISFSGITPGGFNSEKGLILSVIFEAKKEGVAKFEINDARVLRNDGTGSAATLTIVPFEVVVSEGVPAEIFVLPKVRDSEPPESFAPEIARDESIFDGKWFVVFVTQDKSSGIDHYKVCEGSKRKCVTAESPYLLQNQKLDQKIFVKAIDKSGNEREVLLLPQKPKPWYKNYSILAILIIIGLVVAGVILRKILWRKRRK